MIPISLARLRPALALPAVIFAAFAGAAPAGAQGSGSAASTVLRLAPSTRAFALGAAMSGVPDAFAIEFNPAALGPAASRVAASFQALPLDVTAGAASVSFGVPGGAAAVSLRFVDYGEVAVVEEAGGPVGTPTRETATGGEFTALAGYSFAAGPVRLGLAGRWLRLDVAGLRDDAFAADVGAFVAPLDWLTAGVAVQNIGPAVEAGREAPLPLMVRAGLGARRALGAVDVLVAVEGRRREGRNRVGAGLEVGVGGPALRAAGRIGWESRADGDGYSRLVFGAGVHLDRVGVDFAYRALGPLGVTRQIGLSYRL